ncbi:DUF1304 domain-containing protein [Ruania halotolerans]|uniref:DUF1304 domain-containing protein n=1 Tax=Ruania halotolerans TaxID=2897773 RepID=UPI001E45F3E0|nr:DUF1304 domain-containing protein [Ruania halotolerans]UFU05677.1 DUF1304 domain-containing protein [Ruania halotolerans]
MQTVALVLATLAALMHVYIFVLESFAWDTPRGRATFGTTRDKAEATKELAYNQGFYNLFLALITAAGVLLVVMDMAAGAGPALLYAGTGSMALAALVLVTKNPQMARPAVIQGTVPALAVVLLTVALLTG